MSRKADDRPDALMTTAHATPGMAIYRDYQNRLPEWSSPQEDFEYSIWHDEQVAPNRPRLDRFVATLRERLLGVFG